MRFLFCLSRKSKIKQHKEKTINLDREKLNLQLKKLPRNKRALFAVRSAMRVLPLLAVQKKSHRDPFYFWPTEDKAKNLLAIFQVFSVSLDHTLFDNNLVFSHLAFATADATASDASDASDVACAAAAAAGVGAAAFAGTAAIVAAYNADVAVAVDVDVDVDVDIIQEIKHDLRVLEKSTSQDLMKKPLWSKPFSKKWQQLIMDLKQDALSLDMGFQVWLDWYDDRLQGKALEKKLLSRWNSIPKEIEKQGVGRTNAYLYQLTRINFKRPLNRVRAIFIGNGDAGKTSLIRVLHDEGVIKGDGQMTQGVEIRDWDIPNSEIKAHFWDFGGQVMAHSTHQFFLRERCLYIVVLNARSEINSTEQAEYWLEHVKSFGNSAPVMLVGNKSDETQLNLDMGYLTQKEKYPNIVGFYPLSCTHVKNNFKAKFTAFQQDFCRELQAVGTHQMLFTDEQFKVLEELREYSPTKAFLSHQEFNNICAKHGVAETGELNRAWLLDILDKLGVVIHFPQLTFLDDYVLNPRWLTHGVYTIMYAGQAQLTEQRAIEILHDKKIIDEQGNVLDYPNSKCGFILDAMQEFKLAYRLREENQTFIFPELLLSNRPTQLNFDKQAGLAFEFDFKGFLPRHIMPQLTVSRHEDIYEKTVWKNGVLLKSSRFQAQALVEVSYHDRSLSIWVIGKGAKEYLAILNDEVLKVLNRLDLDYKEWIKLPLSARLETTRFVGSHTMETASYRQLLACAKKGETVYISESGTSYDLSMVLDLTIATQALKSLGIHIGQLVNEGNSVKKTNINIGNHNNFGGSVVIAENIKNSFNTLQESKANDKTQKLLTELLTEIKTLNAKVPESQEMQDISEGAETLIKESQRELPRQSWYQASIEGIQAAGKTLGAVADPVIKITKALGLIVAG